MGVNPVVLGLATVDGFHRQRVAEHERDAFGRADVGHPVPREHALDRHHQSVAVGRDDLEERRRGRRHIAVQYHLAGHTHKGTHIIDTHSDHAIDEVWDLYRRSCLRTGNVATLYEWDEDIPEFEVVHAEALKAGALREQALLAAAR